MRTIWKYAVPMEAEFKLAMPNGSEPLAVQLQRGEAQMWALVDTEQPVVTETFFIAGTGHAAPEAIDEAIYVGTFQTGAFVWHLFKR